LNIEHTLAHGLVCIGLTKKVRPFLQGCYPIMAYYNPIIFNDIPIKPLYVWTRYYLYVLELDNFGERLKFFPIAKDLNYKRFLYKTSQYQ
jgi:hypothetical protein